MCSSDLSSSHPTGIDEGGTLRISLSTNVPTGTSIPYTISGIDQSDLSSGSLTGNFVVGTTDYIDLGIALDVTSGEGYETLRLTLPDQNQFIEVTINDTSTTAPSLTDTITTSNGTSLPAISADGQWIVMGESDGIVDAQIFKYNSVNDSWEYSQSVSPPAGYTTSAHSFGVSSSFSSDGSILALGAPYYPNFSSQTGAVFIYERDINDTYIFRDFIPEPNITTKNNFGFGCTLSGDGNTLVVSEYLANAGNKLTTFEYDSINSVWNVVDVLDNWTTYGFKHMYIDMSSDSQLLVASHSAGAFGGGKGVIYERSGQGWTKRDEAIPTTDLLNNMHRGSALSNDKSLLALSCNSYNKGNSNIWLFDWNPTTSSWVQRSDVIKQTISSLSFGANGDSIAMSEPDSNGMVSLITTNGNVYKIPASL